MDSECRCAEMPGGKTCAACLERDLGPHPGAGDPVEQMRSAEVIRRRAAALKEQLSALEGGDANGGPSVSDGASLTTPGSADMCTCGHGREKHTGRVGIANGLFACDLCECSLFGRDAGPGERVAARLRQAAAMYEALDGGDASSGEDDWDPRDDMLSAIGHLERVTKGAPIEIADAVATVRHAFNARPPEADEPRELLCELCGRDYPIWSARSDLWNATFRVDGEEEHAFVCPTCFTLRAALLGVETSFYVTAGDDAPVHTTPRDDCSACTEQDTGPGEERGPLEAEGVSEALEWLVREHRPTKYEPEWRQKMFDDAVAAIRARHGWPKCCGATMTIDVPTDPED